MIRLVSIIIAWVVAVEAGRIIFAHPGSADAESENGVEEKWDNEIDNGDYSDDDGLANENPQDSDIYTDRIIEWKGNNKEYLINDESQNDNNIITSIIINNTSDSGGNDENLSAKEEDETDNSKDCSTEEANVVDHSHGISSTPTDQIWMKKENIDEDFDVIIKRNVKRVKRVSRAGNSRRVKLMQDRHNRLDNSNSSGNHNHHKHKVTDN